ncbi:MAG: hypothetical protein GY823_14135 [Flavobacteriaceae bacterium]|nr:hypothetical protein [Flavobacteriaceae bacterium]
MEEILKKITAIIETYESGVWVSADNLRVMLRELTANNYYLTKYNIEYFQKFNAIQYKHKGSVASGKILAEEQVPELRIIRKIMEATENVMWSMKSELSIIKNEK